MTFCDNCGTELVKGTKFCPLCGKSVQRGERTSIKLKKMVCPNCKAQIKYDGNSDHFTCEYCGIDIVNDDQATELKRILNVKSEAKHRDNQIDLEYEMHHQKLDNRKKVVDFICENPILCIVAILAFIYSAIRMCKGNFAGIDIIFDAVILGIVYNKTKS